MSHWGVSPPGGPHVAVKSNRGLGLAVGDIREAQKINILLHTLPETLSRNSDLYGNIYVKKSNQKVQRSGEP